MFQKGNKFFFGLKTGPVAHGCKENRPTSEVGRYKVLDLLLTSNNVLAGQHHFFIVLAVVALCPVESGYQIP